MARPNAKRNIPEEIFLLTKERPSPGVKVARLRELLREGGPQMDLEKLKEAGCNVLHMFALSNEVVGGAVSPPFLVLRLFS